MMESKRYSNKEIFEYHYFFSKKNFKIRYGIASCPDTPARGVFLLLHGRTEFLEKYKRIAKQLQKKGFQVISLDWPGQGLSSRELDNRHKGHIQRFEDYVDDLEKFYAGVAEPYGLPVYILAHSMGGHIALRFMSRHPLKIKKAVLSSPMIDIALLPGIKQVSKFVSKKLSQTPFAKKYIMGSKDYSAEKIKYKGNTLTHDPENFWISHNEIEKNPALALGGATWGWLNAAFDSIGILKQDEIIDKIITPILMISAQKDSIVSPKAQEKLSRKLSNCTFVSIDGAFHELLFEDARVTCQFWEAFNRFVVE